MAEDYGSGPKGDGVPCSWCGRLSCDGYCENAVAKLHQDVARGDVVMDSDGKMKAMAVADGYVMARRKGCMPFVKSVKEWNQLRELNAHFMAATDHDE